MGAKSWIQGAVKRDMNKFRITADIALKIITDVLHNAEIDSIIESTPEAPEQWKGKKISEILNIEYYAYKNRPKPSEEIIEEQLTENREADTLQAVNRSFCVLELGGIERLFSKDKDVLTAQPTLEYIIQSDKIKLLEYWLETANMALSGVWMPIEVTFTEKTEQGEILTVTETRKVLIIFSNISIREYKQSSQVGESIVAQVGVTMEFTPPVATYSDYTVTIAFTDDDGNEKAAMLPVTSIATNKTNTQKSLAQINSCDIKTINISRATTFAFTFDGYIGNAFVDYVMDKTLKAEPIEDTNKSYYLTIKRYDKEYTHECIIQDHKITMQDNISLETHAIIFTKKYKEVGSA